MKRSCCSTYAQWALSSSKPISVPLKARSAFCDNWMPTGERNARAFNSVVFPAPELPITANISPEFAMPEMFLMRCFRGIGALSRRPTQNLTLLIAFRNTEDCVGISPKTSIFFQVYVIRCFSSEKLPYSFLELSGCKWIKWFQHGIPSSLQ